MNNLSQIFYSEEINWETALVRILVSFILGMIIGVEREAHSQPAGLRTHILISIGSTIVMLISIFIPQTFTQFQNGDPGRIAAQVVSGIGFLGAGAILKFGGDVKGLTTAASIWAIAAIGLAIGAGMFTIGVTGLLVILFALTVMDVFEKKIFKERLIKKIELSVKKKNSDVNHFKIILKEMDIHISSTGFERNVAEATDKITFLVSIGRKTDILQVVNALEKNEGVTSVSIEMIH